MADADTTRIERDTMGEMLVPADAYFGASTQRAVLNFPISGTPMPRRFIWALGTIKQASAEVNRDLGLLDSRVAEAIGRSPRDAEAAPRDDAEADHDQRRANQAELLRDHRKDEVGMRLGQVKELLHPSHQASSSDTAGADRNQ